MDTYTRRRMVIFEDMHPLKKLFFTAFIVVAIMTVTMLAAMAISVPIFGLSFSDIQNVAALNNSAVLKFLQFAQALGLFIIPSFIALYLFTLSPLAYLKLNNTPKLGALALCVFIMATALPLINYIAEINKSISLPYFMEGVEQWMRDKEAEAMSLTTLLLEANSLWGLLINVFIIAVLPAVGEEILFRGVIQQLIKEWLKNKHLAVWLSAILFSALHMQFLGFFPRMFMGAVFGYIFIWGKSLWFPITAHFVNNGVAVVTLYFYGDDMEVTNIEDMGAKDGGSAFFSLLLVSMAIYGFYKIKHKTTEVIQIEPESSTEN